MKGVNFKRNSGNSFAVVRLHYTADPDKDPGTERGKVWYDTVRRGMPEEGWQREYEINFTTMEGRPVYADFNMAQAVRLKWNKTWVLYRGWDMGYHRPACHFSCFDNKDRWLWLYPEILGYDINLFDFLDYVFDLTQANFPNAMIRDFVPHDARHVDEKAKEVNLNTDLKIMMSKGLTPEISPITNVFDGVKLIRQKMLLRKDGEYGTLVDDRNTVCIEALQGGYHRNPKESKGEEIVKDGYFDHLMDAARSTAVNVLSPDSKQNIQSSVLADPSAGYQYSYLTGEIIG